MTPLALIVEWHTPDLLALCRASLARFAPEVEVMILPGGPGAEYHALAIHRARAQLRGVKSQHDPIILLDTDTCILSERWWPTLEKAFGEDHDLVGGHRSRGEACQMFEGRYAKLHASMLAIQRGLFDRVSRFDASPLDHEMGCVVDDTAWRVSLEAASPKILAFHPVSAGPIFPGLQVGEYFDPAAARPETLWSHLWRGTGMPAGPRWRQALRLFRAACGSQAAWTMLRAQERKARWMEKAWEIVRAG